MPTLSLLFSSPRTIRRMLVTGFLASSSLWLVWLVASGIPADRPEVEYTVERTIVLVIMFSFLAWANVVHWRNLRLELRYGSLLQMEPSHATFSTDIQTVDRLPVPVLPDRSSEEKLKWPWASLLCATLLVWGYFQCFSNVSEVPTWSILLFYLLVFWILKPYFCVSNLLGEVNSYQQYITDAEGESFLPLDKHQMPITDSNFYRYHAKRLEALKFVLLYECRFHNTFCAPDETVTVTLGRPHPMSTNQRDFFCLTSIDEDGQIFQTHSGGGELHAVSTIEPKWTLQSVDENNFDAAIAMHKSLMKQHIPHQSLLALGQRNYVALQRYIYEVTARTRARFYNLNQRHFA